MGNGSELQVVLFIQEIIVKSSVSVTGSELDAHAEMKRINDSVEQQNIKIFRLNDMKIASDNKSQRDVNGTHNARVISESNTSRYTVKRTPALSEIVTSRDATKSVMVAEDIPEIMEMTTTITNPISAKQTVYCTS